MIFFIIPHKIEYWMNYHTKTTNYEDQRCHEKTERAAINLGIIIFFILIKWYYLYFTVVLQHYISYSFFHLGYILIKILIKIILSIHLLVVSCFIGCSRILNWNITGYPMITLQDPNNTMPMLISNFSHKKKQSVKRFMASIKYFTPCVIKHFTESVK